MKKLLVSELIHAVNGLATSEIRTTCELSTLVDFDDHSTIMVDRTATITGGHEVVLTYEVRLEQQEGKLVCTGVDPNPENTYVHLELGDIALVYEGEDWEPSELASVTAFKQLILDTQLNSLTMDVVDSLLKQILVDYAVSSTLLAS